MKRIDFRIIVGGALILLGALMLLERIGIFRGAAGFFWGLVLLAGGAYFLNRFIRAPRLEWWASLPGFALVGLGAAAVLPEPLSGWSGLLFLGFLGLGFYAVYFTGRERWWALIPGGVLVTLGITSVLGDIYGVSETGGIFLLGLGLAFISVAILASAAWAYIPGVILLLVGALLSTAYSGLLGYVWPAVLIFAGLLLIYQFVRHK